MTNKELKNILDKHAKWVEDEKDPAGKQADFSGQDLHDMDFSGANVFRAIFKNAKLDNAKFIGASAGYANFRNAYLENADFSDADVNDCDFTNAKLINAVFADASLQNTNFTGADCTSADFNHARFDVSNLTNANFTDADLNHAVFGDVDKEANSVKFTGANFTGTNFYQISYYNYDRDERNSPLHYIEEEKKKKETTIKTPVGLGDKKKSSVPMHGSFTGWAVLDDGLIAQLLIPAEAGRSNTAIPYNDEHISSFPKMAHNLCRCEYAEVVAIYNGNKKSNVGKMTHDTREITFEAGKIVRSYSFDINSKTAATDGIHFYMTKREAEDYKEMIKYYDIAAAEFAAMLAK